MVRHHIVNTVGVMTPGGFGGVVGQKADTSMAFGAEIVASKSDSLRVTTITT